ncbi:MAG: hypothetical protein ABIV50_02435 [Opitutus sp.]
MNSSCHARSEARRHPSEFQLDCDVGEPARNDLQEEFISSGAKNPVRDNDIAERGRALPTNGGRPRRQVSAAAYEFMNTAHGWQNFRSRTE